MIFKTRVGSLYVCAAVVNEDYSLESENLGIDDGLRKCSSR